MRFWDNFIATRGDEEDGGGDGGDGGDGGPFVDGERFEVAKGGDHWDE